MSQFNDLVTYFENLARKHVSIRHTDTEKHFFRMEIDEVLSGITRTDVKHPYLILEGYYFKFKDNKSDNVLKNRNGAFTLLDYVSDPTDYDAICNAWERMEAIGDDILIKIKSDKRNPMVKSIRDFNFSEVEGTLVANEIDGNYGMRYTYSLDSALPTDVDPDKWLPEGSM